MNLIDFRKALVTKKFNQFFYVDILDEDQLLENSRFLCTKRKAVNFNNKSIHVGDKVTISQINFKEKTAIIENLIERTNILIRPSVANISDIFVTCSVDEPKLNFSQMTKFLINAEYLNVEVSLILTKCDLIDNRKKSWLAEKFIKWGYPPIMLNKNDQITYQNFLNELKKKKCSILMGPSGVGKTTLLNKIIPDLNNKTSPVSSKIKRGKNTTRNVELFPLSPSNYIVDTPGFNLQKVEITSQLIQNLFPEIVNQFVNSSIECKFRNCLHIHEPGCNLNKKFERYKYYKELVEYSKNHYSQILED